MKKIILSVAAVFAFGFANAQEEVKESKGFGFVTFVEESSAQAAVKEMNGSDVEGRPLTVNEAKQ